jgi:hypothetical protein
VVTVIFVEHEGLHEAAENEALLPAGTPEAEKEMA